MRRFIVIVLDGFGVGQMPDADESRPDGMKANTAAHIAEKFPEMRLPVLEKLGLMNAAGFETSNMRYANNVTFGRAALAHFGADTFWGHQEIMGTLPKKPVLESFAPRFDAVRTALEKEKHRVEIYTGSKGRMLIVDGCVTVADNIECDPGLAVNVTAAIDDIPFDKVLEIGKIVRGQVYVSRVVTFGGRGVHLENLLNAVEERDNGFIGVNAPKSGVYERDYHCIHLGYGVNPEVQAPYILAGHGVSVYLLGKAADIVENPCAGQSFSIVPTAEVMAKTAEVVAREKTCFICANVQETDLCGHRENASDYLSVLQEADAGIGRIISLMDGGDILLVMADHGNDPTVGHSRHTREYVPLLLYGNGLRPCDLGVRDTLSDVAATACRYFDAPPPENGNEFLSLILK